MVVKHVPVSVSVRNRVVLDLSRHVNLCEVDGPVKLDDLTVAEKFMEKDDFLAAFDLKKQFFHVKLHHSVK